MRSPDSCKPNFRWIGIPVRTLPVLDPTQAQLAGLALTLSDTNPAGEQLVSERSVTTSSSSSAGGSAFSAASTGGSAFSTAASDGGAGAALVGVSAAAFGTAGGTPSLPWKALRVETPTPTKGNGVDGGNASLGTVTGDVWNEDGIHDIGEVWTPLAAAVAGFGIEVGYVCKELESRCSSQSLFLVLLTALLCAYSMPMDS